MTKIVPYVVLNYAHEAIVVMYFELVIIRAALFFLVCGISLINKYITFLCCLFSFSIHSVMDYYKS